MPKKKEAQTPEDQIKELQKQIAELEKQTSQLQSQNLMLLSQPAASAQSVQTQPSLPQKPKLNLEGLPDPVTESDKYHKELSRRHETYYEELRKYDRAVEKANQAASAAQAEPDTNALWEAYKEDYPQYAKSEAKVRTAATMAVERMTRRGINVDNLMRRSPEEFFAAVNKVYDKEFGEPEDDDNDDTKKKKSAKDDEDDPTGRTAGMFGGQETGQKPTKSKGKDDDDDGVPFTKQLEELQSSMWSNDRARSA